MNIPSKISSSQRIAAEVMRNAGVPAENINWAILSLFRAQVEMRRNIGYKGEQSPPEGIEIVDCLAKKPCDYVKMGFVRIGESISNGVAPFFVPIAPQLVGRNCENCQVSNRNSVFQVHELEYHFQVSSNANGLKLHVQYQAYRLDEYGYPLMDSEYVMAYEAWLRWRWIVRRRMESRDSFTISDEQNAKFEFFGAKARVRGRLALESLTREEQDQIAQKWQDPHYFNENPLIQLESLNNDAYLRGFNDVGFR